VRLNKPFRETTYFIIIRYACTDNSHPSIVPTGGEREEFRRCKILQYSIVVIIYYATGLHSDDEGTTDTVIVKLLKPGDQ